VHVHVASRVGSYIRYRHAGMVTHGDARLLLQAMKALIGTVSPPSYVCFVPIFRIETDHLCDLSRSIVISIGLNTYA